MDEATIAHGSLALPRRRWISPAGLDRLLLAGADPDGSPALRRRTRTLASQRRRERLALGRENEVVAARAPRVPLSSVVPVRRAEVRATERLMLELRRADPRERRAPSRRPDSRAAAPHVRRRPLFAPCGAGGVARCRHGRHGCA